MGNDNKLLLFFTRIRIFEEKNMNTIELKNNFHLLIDSINNDNILSKFYAIMARTKERSDGKLWGRLTEEEQEELIRADIESNDPSNLISHSEIQKKHNKWL